MGWGGARVKGRASSTSNAAHRAHPTGSLKKFGGYWAGGAPRAGWGAQGRPWGKKAPPVSGWGADLRWTWWISETGPPGPKPRDTRP